MKSILISILLICSMAGSWHPSTHLPLNEKEVRQLMAEHVNIDGWKMARKGHIYTFWSVPEAPSSNGLSYGVNAMTGTVYDAVSGGPLWNLLIKDAPDLDKIVSGEQYQKVILKLADQAIKTSGMTTDRKQWVSGGYGEGFIYGDVIKDHRRIYIKLDVFTQQWEEIEDPWKN
ncbi:hypothetical protein J2TS6_02860 [Paenibacillus albilobatus]|uniref:Uncharacterized protein n=2 Tax=Paenibacillus TaxID=44249 RepID=A0A919XDS0_9BACL|nr:hypothetical protein [Paenibacillus albilobatus]GIO29145.1 hypothetical protein J2TS6_02860 [Paenibacillus albilobatus]